MPTKKRMYTVKLESLAICRSCGVVFSKTRLIFREAGGACPNPYCGEELHAEDFGQFEGPESGNWRRLLWVGPGGFWTTVKPTEPFEVEAKLGFNTPSRRVRVTL